METLWSTFPESFLVEAGNQAPSDKFTQTFDMFLVRRKGLVGWAASDYY